MGLAHVRCESIIFNITLNFAFKLVLGVHISVLSMTVHLHTRMILCSSSCRINKHRLNHCSKHPLCLPDLSPCDFFLFHVLKKVLAGHHCNFRRTFNEAVYQCLQSISRTGYSSAFSSCTSWTEKCISEKG